MAGAAGEGGVVAAAWAEAEPGFGGGGGSVGESGAAGPGDEAGSGVSAGLGGGLVLDGERGSPLGWSHALHKEPSGRLGSGQRENYWAGHANEPASPTPIDHGRRVTPSVSVHLL